MLLFPCIGERLSRWLWWVGLCIRSCPQEQLVCEHTSPHLAQSSRSQALHFRYVSITLPFHIRLVHTEDCMSTFFTYRYIFCQLCTEWYFSLNVNDFLLQREGNHKLWKQIIVMVIKYDQLFLFSQRGLSLSMFDVQSWQLMFCQHTLTPQAASSGASEWITN